MNIKQAKEQIQNAMKAYFTKDGFGNYLIPIERQRPIFLMGPPGIGKTAIMEQIAQELGIALVSYSMTHHTRQSALGLPFIVKKNYGGTEYDVSEYTMSEIIASVYDTMEASGVKEGILFLDEINCVSETLAPSMLQFLQYKVFGRHKVPEGWVIVTAGNPPEYNKSVREFDVVTMDRLKILEVEADYRVWKSYAGQRNIHNAIINYLDLKKDDFYHMEMTVRGRSYVTARGWEDLSEMITLYEEEEMPVDETLVEQYIREPRIVKEFTAYYDLYNKYKKDYKIGEILSGRPSDAAKERAKAAPFDERLSLLGMLLDKVQSDIKEVIGKSDYLTDLLASLKGVKALLAKEEQGNAETLRELLCGQEKRRADQMESLEKAGALSAADRSKFKRIIRFLQEAEKTVVTCGETDGNEAFLAVKQKFDSEVAEMKMETMAVKECLHHLFAFVEAVFADGNEMLILVTELTVNTFSARFITMFGCEDYQKHNEKLMLSERQNDIKDELNELLL